MLAIVEASISGPAPAGLAAAIAVAAVEAGGVVQLIGKVGDDPDGDAALLALGRAGIGHVAMLRDAGHRTPVVRVPATSAHDGDDGDRLLLDALGDGDGHGHSGGDGHAGRFAADLQGELNTDARSGRPTLDAADVELALRYLPDVRVVALVEPVEGLVAVAVAEAAAAGAHLTVIVASEEASGVPALDLVPLGALVLVAPQGGDAATFALLVGRYLAAVDAGADPATAFGAGMAALSGERATG